MVISETGTNWSQIILLLTISTEGALVVSGTTTLTGGLTVVGAATGVYQKPTGGIPNSDLATPLVIGTTSTTAMAGNKTAADLGGIQLGTTAGKALEATVMAVAGSNKFYRTGFAVGAAGYKKIGTFQQKDGYYWGHFGIKINMVVSSSNGQWGTTAKGNVDAFIDFGTQTLTDVGYCYYIQNLEGTIATNGPQLKIVRVDNHTTDLYAYCLSSGSSQVTLLSFSFNYDNGYFTFTPSSDAISPDPPEGMLDIPERQLMPQPPATGQYTLISNNGVISWVLSL
jgi:hypothetical protein